MAIFEYTLTLRIYKLLTRKREKIVCWTCGGLIQLNDRVITKRSGVGDGGTRIRHVECAKKAMII